MKDLRTKAMNVLMQMGVNPSLNGFRYTLDALDIINEDSKALAEITPLYGRVADGNKDIKATATRVERGIRHLVDITYTNEVFMKYIPHEGKKPSNSKFLSTLYFKLIQEDKSNSTEQVKQVRPTESDGDTCAFCSSKLTIFDVQGIHICEECAKKIAIKFIEL